MENKLEQRVMYELPGLFIYIQSNRKSIDAELIMQKTLIAKKLDIKDEDLLFMILELYTL